MDVLRLLAAGIGVTVRAVWPGAADGTVAGFQYLSLFPLNPTMKSLNVAGVLVLCVGAFFAGCESGGVSSRIQEKSGAFGSLPPEQQAVIKDGMIDVGFTEDMAYMALGRPTTKETGTNSEGKTMTTWVYRKFFGKAGSATPMLYSPSNRMQQVVVSPQSAEKGGKHAAPSLFSTTGGPQTNLDVPDMVPQKLTVFFVDGRVVSADMVPEK